MPFLPTYRTVILETSVQERIEAENKNNPRFHEAWSALEWLLSRRGTAPDFGRYGDDGFRLYKQAGDRLANTPDIKIVYRLVNEEIVVIAIEVEYTDSEGTD